MEKKVILTIIGCLMLFVNIVHTEVIRPNVYQPSVPNYMDSFQFQSVQNQIFGSYSSGMFPNIYSEISWNPANITSLEKTRAYLEINPNISKNRRPGYIYSNYRQNTLEEKYIINTEYAYRSRINRLNTEPLYNFSYLTDLTQNIYIGFFNRTIMDFGEVNSYNTFDTYRSTRFNHYSYSAALSSNISISEDIEASDFTDNHQNLKGNQSVLFLGYNVSDKVELGVSWEHYFYNHEGEIFVSEWSEKLHKDNSVFRDENLI